VSLWGVHLGVAGIVTVLVLFVLAPGTRARVVVVPASMLWAILPDFHHAFRFVPVLQQFPGVRARWRAVHDSAFADLFWFHRAIDQADPRDRVAFALVMWALLLVVLVVTEVAIRRRRSARSP
jgi:hypothetical protein